MKYLLTAVKVALLVCVVLFCIFNREIVHLVLIPGKPAHDLPLFLPILCGILLGVIITILVMMGDRYRISKDLKKARKDLATVQNEVQKLHNLPLMDNEKK